MPQGWKRMLASSLLVLSAGCGDGPSAPTQTIAGQWSGTTSQGTPFTFMVSGDSKVTSLTFGYSFGGCTGSLAYTPDILLETIATAPVPVYTGHYESGPVGSPNRVLITFLLTSTTEAHGMVVFVDYAGCGQNPATGAWTATKR